MESEEKTKDDELLTLAEAAAKLRRSVACVRSWISKRQIAAFKINSTYFVRESEVHRILDENFIPMKESSLCPTCRRRSRVGAPLTLRDGTPASLEENLAYESVIIQTITDI